MGGKKSKSDESSTPFPNNLFQNQNYTNYGNHGQNNHMNHQNQFNHQRHNHGHHNHWNHRANNHHNHHNHHNHNHHNHNNHHNNNHFNPHNNFNQNDQVYNHHPSPHADGYNEHFSFPPEGYPQDPFQHPDPRYMDDEGPRPIMNPHIDRMNNYRRMRRRPRRRVRRRRAFDPFVDGEFLAENNPEFFADSNRPRYLTNRDAKIMKNTYWNPEDDPASSHHSASNTLSSERNNSHAEKSDLSEPKSPLENLKPPKLKKLNLKPFKRVDIPDIKFEQALTEPSKVTQKNNVLARYNKKKYPTTFYAKPVRPKKVVDELHFKVFNNRENPLNTAKYMISSIRVPKAVNNEITIKVEQ